jgi:hypothetical protein
LVKPRDLSVLLDPRNEQDEASGGKGEDAQAGDHLPCTVHVDVNRGTSESGHALSRRVDTLHSHLGIPESIAPEALGDDASFVHSISSLSFIGARSRLAIR